jgi:microcystin-dependent protein
MNITKKNLWERLLLIAVLIIAVVVCFGEIRNLRKTMDVVSDKQNRLEDRLWPEGFNTGRIVPVLSYLADSTLPGKLSVLPVSETFYQNDLKYDIPTEDNPFSGSFVNLYPGAGFLAQDALVAKSRPFAFEKAVEDAKQRSETKNPRPATPIMSSAKSITDVTEEFEAKMLYTTFSAKLTGWGATLDLSMSRQKAREELSKNTIVYIIASTTGGNSMTVDDKLCKWDDAALKKVLLDLEAIEDDDVRRVEFANKFGSHYVKTVEYGSKIVIRASMSSIEKEASDKFKAALAAGGWEQRMAGQFEQDYRSVSSQYNCTFEMNAIAHSEPSNAFFMTVNDIEKVRDKVAQIESGEIKFQEVPISFTLASYESTIDGEKYPKIKAMFKKNYPPAPITTVDQLTVPAGTVLPFAGTDVPPGYLLCDGKFLDGRQYPRLYSAIGKSYGKDDARPYEFRLPDYRGYFLRGADLTSGHDPDTKTRQPLGDGVPEAVGSKQESELTRHTHATETFSRRGWPKASNDETSDGSPFYFKDQSKARDKGQNNVTMLGIEASGGSETRPVNISINYIIKY